MILEQSEPTKASKAHVSINADYVEIILKVAERCNLACPYCYFFFSGDESYRSHPPLLLETLVADTITFIEGLRNDAGASQVRVILHGGEPLLLNKLRFRALCEAFRSKLGPDPALVLAVQTNGVLIDSDWIQIFSEFNVRVGVTIDGPQSVHDTNRITRKGKGSYDQTRRGWEALLDAANCGRINYPGLLCVVSPTESGRAIFKHLIGDLHARGISFLLPDLTYEAEILNEEYVSKCAEFLIEVAEEWLATDQRGVSVRFLDELIGPLLDDELLRRSAFGYDPSRQFCIASDGTVYPDDVIRSFAPRFIEIASHVGSSNLTNLTDAPAWQELADAFNSLPTKCQSCKWRNPCRGGQLHHRFSSHNGFKNPSIYCEGLKQIYGYVFGRLITAGFNETDLNRRLGVGEDMIALPGTSNV